MSSMNLQIVGLKELEADIRRAGFNVRPLMQGAAGQATHTVQRNIRQEAPHKTGALQRGVQAIVNYPTAIVQEVEKYGQWVEDGTRPHTITPKVKQAVFWKGALNPYRAVKHPGTKANPFFSRGVEKSRDAVVEPFLAVATKLVTIMAGK